MPKNRINLGYWFTNKKRSTRKNSRENCKTTKNDVLSSFFKKMKGNARYLLPQCTDLSISGVKTCPCCQSSSSWSSLGVSGLWLICSRVLRDYSQSVSWSCGLIWVWMGVGGGRGVCFQAWMWSHSVPHKCLLEGLCFFLPAEQRLP